jgi:AcrR family transcriptional regulator
VRHDGLLDEAENRRSFGAAGADAPTDEVARRAGVGIGTVFRHFPTKRDLLEATVVQHFDRLTQAARAPDATLDAVLGNLISTGATKLVLLNRLAEMGDATASVAKAAQDLKAAVGHLLRREQRAGAVRPDVTVEEVYLLVRALAGVVATAAPATTRRAVHVILDGLRPVSSHHTG